MTLSIEVTPELENKLREEATRLGLSIEEYARSILERQAIMQAGMPPFGDAAAAEGWIKEFRVWAASHDRNTPPISIDALRRENMYEDRS